MNRRASYCHRSSEKHHGTIRPAVFCFFFIRIVRADSTRPPVVSAIPRVRAFAASALADLLQDTEAGRYPRSLQRTARPALAAAGVRPGIAEFIGACAGRATCAGTGLSR